MAYGSMILTCLEFFCTVLPAVPSTCHNPCQSSRASSNANSIKESDPISQPGTLLPVKTQDTLFIHLMVLPCLPFIIFLECRDQVIHLRTIVNTHDYPFSGSYITEYFNCNEIVFRPKSNLNTENKTPKFLLTRVNAPLK